MAMRFIALLIPLAITLPQLQTSRPAAPEPQPPVALTQPAAEAESIQQTQLSNAAVTRVAVEPPPHDAQRSLDIATIDTPVVATVAAAAAPEVHRASHKRAAPKPARAASPVELVAASAAPGRAAARAASRKMTPLLAADTGCLPRVHCAPVVVAKITPVTRRPL